MTLTPRKIEKNVFQPKIIKNWTPEKLNSLATSGIYTQQDLEKFEERLLFPLEKKSIVNTIAKFTQSANSAKDDLMSNSLTEKTLIHIAESTWNKIIKKYDNKRIYTPKIIRMFQPPICVNIHIRHTSTSSVKQDQRYGKINKKNKEGTSSELQEIVVTKPTISMPVKEHNSVKIEEHELREFKPREVVNLRP